MTIACLHMNDQNLLISSGDGARYAESGFARVTPRGIRTGERARALAWREPQHSHNQYWAFLNQSALPAPQKLARHHADIAFAQLKSLWKAADEPEELVLLVPACFSNEQLALLLGLVKALPAEPVAIIDSAVTAALTLPSEGILIDVQLHQTVATHIRRSGGSVTVDTQEVFPDLGMVQIHNSVARYISRLLIDSARYDPLHASGSEQFIFDQTDEWLNRSRWEPEFSATIPSAQGDLPFIFRNSELKKSIEDRLTSLNAFLGRFPGVPVWLSAESAGLAAISDDLREVKTLESGAAITGFAIHEQEILDQIDGIFRVQQLNLTAQHDSGTQNISEFATHLLHGDRAVSIERPVSITEHEGSLSVGRNSDPHAGLTLVRNHDGIQVLNAQAGLEFTLPDTCTPGQSILVAGNELKLIKVDHA